MGCTQTKEREDFQEDMRVKYKMSPLERELWNSIPKIKNLKQFSSLEALEMTKTEIKRELSTSKQKFNF